jgi:hypothetical protein
VPGIDFFLGATAIDNAESTGYIFLKKIFVAMQLSEPQTIGIKISTTCIKK